MFETCSTQLLVSLKHYAYPCSLCIVSSIQHFAWDVKIGLALAAQLGRDEGKYRFFQN